MKKIKNLVVVLSILMVTSSFINCMSFSRKLEKRRLRRTFDQQNSIDSYRTFLSSNQTSESRTNALSCVRWKAIEQALVGNFEPELVEMVDDDFNNINISVYTSLEEIEVLVQRVIQSFAEGDINEILFGYLRILNPENCDDIIRSLVDVNYFYVNLKNLWITEQQLAILLPILFQFDSLVSIDISNNLLTELPEGILELRRLLYINFSNNLLSVIPEWIGGLSNLFYIDFSNNNLMFVPESIYQSDKLEHIKLDGNVLLN